ncbi:MAG: hypothetical protein HZY75_05875 [Nocardioidaceae bacterium]|nr:MAG: hypothetical protein HZY75_05875 [Nocardioidaceae bacterium]
MIYTMGMALSRALDNHTEVEVLVDGQWLTGMVVVNDGYGVVLDGGHQHAIIKVENISAVRIMTASPMRPRITEGYAESGSETFDDYSDSAMPMPGPRIAAESLVY